MHLNDEGIALYADAIKFNKIPQLPNGFKTHVESCPVCQQQIVDFSSIMVDIKQDSVSAHPFFDSNKKTTSLSKPNNENVRYLFYKIAAIAVILMIVLFTYRQFSVEKPSEIVEKNQENIEQQDEIQKEIILPETQDKEELVEKPNDTKNQDLPKPHKPKIDQEERNNRELFAANFILNEEFESMLGTTSRSENFEIESPQDDSVFKEQQSIPFKWRNNIKLILTILDNQEEEVFMKKVEGKTFDFNSNLKPGVYYWKLETEEDLLHLGKFTIE